MPSRYACKGRYEDLSTGFVAGEKQDPLETRRKATNDEVRRAARLAEVAIESIGGLNEAVSGQ